MTNAKRPDKPEPSSSPTIVEVAEPHASWLGRLDRRWTPPSLRRRRLKELHWGDLDLSDAEIWLTIDQKRWTLSVQAVGREFISLSRSDVQHGKALSGRTDDGFIFSAKHGFATGVRNFETLTLEGIYCLLLTTAQPARLWVGELDCKIPHTTDNLVVVVRGINGRSTRMRCGLRLQGNKYTYFIVPRTEGARCGVLLDLAGDPAPEFSTLDDDLRSMEVALGQPVQIDVLYAYDDAERLLGYSDADIRRKSSSYGQREKSADSPVPTFLSRIAWVAPFFTSLSQAFGRHDSTALKGAMLSYVESVGDSTIDERYIRLHLAIGALAHAVLQEQSPDALKIVRDGDKWRDWLMTQQGVLAQHAFPQAVDDLMASLIRAGRPDPDLLIRRALEYLDLPLLPELKEELDHRDTAIEAGIMGGDFANDLEAMVRRVQILRVILVALLARWIGYDGALNGWARDRSNVYQPAAWWIINQETAQAAWCRFRAEMTDGMLDIWPDFTKPAIPTAGPLAAIARFADSLTNKTNGQVIATFQPVPQSSGEKMFEFKIMVAGNVGTQVTFFSATESEHGDVRLLGWGDEPMLGQDEVLVTKYLEQIARSDDMRETVERLLILADELRGGER